MYLEIYSAGWCSLRRIMDFKIGAAGANKPDPKEVITQSTPLVPITLKCIKINFKIDAAGAHSWEDAEKLMSIDAAIAPKIQNLFVIRRP